MDSATGNLVYGITREIAREVARVESAGLTVESKGDASPVTALDRRVEEIVIREILAAFGPQVLVIGEETCDGRFPSVDEACQASLLLTVDGIDGTRDFVRHMRDGDANRKWLAGLTCLMRRPDGATLFEPLLAFAYRPTTQDLFWFEAGRPRLVCGVLSAAEQVVDLTAPAWRDSPRGCLDSAIKRGASRYTVADATHVVEYGPSGYNMTELARSTRRDADAATAVNFTMFQHKIWDFGLWPLLAYAGYDFLSLHTGRPVAMFDPRLFDDGTGALSLIRDPLLICVGEHYETIRRAIRP